jgi:hypothetical protein
MIRVQVLIPFSVAATNQSYVPGDVIEVSAELLAKIRAINVNMVLVLGEVEEKPKVTKKTKKKATE